MSWGWTRASNLYLSPSLVLCQVGQRVNEYTPPLTGGIAAALEAAVSGLTPRDGSGRWSVYLGGAYAPAVSLEIPPTVTGWPEYQQLALAVAAARLNTDVDKVCIGFDADCPGLIAATSSTVVAELEEWTRTHGLNLGPIHPFWQLKVSHGQSVAQPLALADQSTVTVLQNGSQTGAVTSTRPPGLPLDQVLANLGIPHAIELGGKGGESTRMGRAFPGHWREL